MSKAGFELWIFLVGWGILFSIVGSILFGTEGTEPKNPRNSEIIVYEKPIIENILEIKDNLNEEGIIFRNSTLTPKYLSDRKGMFSNKEKYSIEESIKFFLKDTKNISIEEVKLEESYKKYKNINIMVIHLKPLDIKLDIFKWDNNIYTNFSSTNVEKIIDQMELQ